MTASGIGGGGGRDVGGLGDLAAGVDDDVGAADVFVEGAFVGEGDAGGGDGAPEGGRGVHHGGGLLVGDLGVERTLVDVVVELAAGPVDGLAMDAGVEEGGAGDVFGSAGAGDRGGEESGDGDEQCWKQGGAGFGQDEHDSLWRGKVHVNGLRGAGKIRDS